MYKKLFIVGLLLNQIASGQDSISLRKARVIADILNRVCMNNVKIDSCRMLGTVDFRARSVIFKYGATSKHIDFGPHKIDTHAASAFKRIFAKSISDSAMIIYDDTLNYHRGTLINYNVYLNPFKIHPKYSEQLFFEIQKPMDGWETLEMYATYKYYLKTGVDFSDIIEYNLRSLFFPVFYWHKKGAVERQNFLLFQYQIEENKNTGDFEMVFKKIIELK